MLAYNSCLRSPARVRCSQPWESISYLETAWSRNGEYIFYTFKETDTMNKCTRLNEQHDLLRYILGYTTHPSILKHLAFNASPKIADIGCGTV